MNTRTHRAGRLAAAALFASVALAACAGTTSSTPPSTSGSGTVATTAASGQVLPVTDNPINNTSTVEALKIDSVLVENNVDTSGSATDDHLEIAVTNTGSSELTGFEVYYTFTDPTAGTSESYFTKLSDSFTVPAGASRIIHFDNTGALDHYPVNEFSLYATSLNALDVTVEVSAHGAAPQTTTVHKDAGGQETAD
ncbi:MAG: hypothetical protein M5U23_06515 [Acidimicrobiia bacterium]|nr:hypothetical protein [Acidimicrobiia bacterium]